MSVNAGSTPQPDPEDGTALPTQLGKRLKAARLARGLDLAAVAEACGVESVVIEQIEQSSQLPSLGIVWQLASGLNVPFAEILGVASECLSVQRRSDQQVLRSSDGTLESRPLVFPGANPWVEIYELTLAPRGTHPSDPHPRGTRETIIVLEGALRIRIDGQTLDLGAGDSASFRADKPHSYENPADAAGRYHNVIVYSR
jgi:transcriptional regulator with XRE-family HTH domain